MDLAVVWLLLTGALVLFMTPGLAFFYGGLVRAKSVVSMMMLSFGAIGLVGVLWVLFGFNEAFVDGSSSDWIPEVLGNPFTDFGLTDAAKAASAGGDSLVLASAFFGSTFAIITVALISGAIADRARFFPWMLFAGLFATLVYFPVAAWVFSFTTDDKGVPTFTGWVGQLGPHLGLDTFAIDYAG
ncbi:MAG: ammonium transporter, partial [Actinomycetales bacterium]